jgi:hypothetical protein
MILSHNAAIFIHAFNRRLSSIPGDSQGNQEELKTTWKNTNTSRN